MNYRIIPVTAFSQNCSLVWCEQTRLAAIVDPGGDAERIKQEVAASGVTFTPITLTHGHLDDVPVDDVLDFETKMFDFFDANYAELLNVITETNDLPEEAKLDEAIKAFKNTTNY